MEFWRNSVKYPHFKSKLYSSMFHRVHYSRHLLLSVAISTRVYIFSFRLLVGLGGKKRCKTSLHFMSRFSDGIQMGFVYGDPLSVFMFLVFFVPGTGVRCHVLVGMQVCNGTTTSSAALAAGLQGTTVLRLSHIHHCHLFVSFVLPVFL